MINQKCNLLVPNTFIMCGEGGNFCSNTCLEDSLKKSILFDDFYLKFVEAKTYPENYNQRIGQLLFNVLGVYAPHIADSILHTEYDSFYNDKAVDNTLEYLRNNWDKLY